MRQYFKVGITLALICAVAATALAFVNHVTKEKIATYEESVVLDAYSEVSAGFTVGELIVPTDEMVSEYHPLTNSSGNISGYIVMLNANGYGGEMTIMASYGIDGEVLGAKLLGNSETPGLGKKAESKTYMEKFVGTGSVGPIPVKKSELSKADAESIGGATVTFSGIAKALAYGSDYVKNLGVK
ncbi:MAG: FMN-binding protein [Sphaerochaetaceae bacterium]